MQVWKHNNLLVLVEVFMDTFHDTFSCVIKCTSVTARTHDMVLKATWINTPLGPMLIIADDQKLYLVKFVKQDNLKQEVEKFQLQVKVLFLLICFCNYNQDI